MALDRFVSPYLEIWFADTHAAGQMLVSTKRGVLDSACGGSDGPNVREMVRATSSDIYVVATKKNNPTMESG